MLAHGLPVADGIDKPESVVCVLTGHGLKDPDSALGKAPAVTGYKAELSAVEKAVFDWKGLEPESGRASRRALGAAASPLI